MDKFYRMDLLKKAFFKVKANGGGSGVDHVTIEHYEKNLEDNLKDLSEQLKDGTYSPQPIRRVNIPKPGREEKRPLGIPTVRDRIVQTALKDVLEPIFEQEFADNSFGFRCKFLLDNDPLVFPNFFVIVNISNLLIRPQQLKCSCVKVY